MLFFDACAIIYLLEAVDNRGNRVRSLVRNYLDNTNKPLMISSLSLLECRVLPQRQGNTFLLARYERFFTSDNVYIIEINHEVLNLATDLRARYTIRTPDALQAACALSHDVDDFVTGDKRFCSIQELSVTLV